MLHLVPLALALVLHPSSPTTTACIRDSSGRPDFSLVSSALLRSGLVSSVLSAPGPCPLDAVLTWGLCSGGWRNSLPGMCRVGDKPGLHAMVRMHGTDFSPPSFLLPDEDAAFAGAEGLWAVKVPGTWSGRGVSVERAEDLRRHRRRLFTREGRVVAQKYVDNPILVLGHKFDVRWWVLVRDVFLSNVTINADERISRGAFMVNDGYLKIAKAMPYSTSHTHRCAHITNNVAQAACPGTPGTDAALYPTTMRDASQRGLFGEGVTWDKDVWPETTRVIRAYLKAAMFSLLEAGSAAAAAAAQWNGGRFQMLSFDVIYSVEASGLRAWVLEANTNGYLGSGFTKMRPGENGVPLLEEMFRLVLAPRLQPQQQHNEKTTRWVSL